MGDLSEAPVYRVTDTSLRSNDSERKESKAKAKQFFPSLQRAGRIPAIVEYVFNASRFKVSIPKENCIVTLALEGIRTPSTKSEDNDPWGSPSSSFTYDRLFQRDVEVIINTIDQGGNFIGLLFYNSQNFALTLLEAGYAKINETIIDRCDYAAEFKKAQALAKTNKLRIWEKEEESEAVEKQIRWYNVTVSEIVDASTFYVQITDDQPRLDKLMAELNSREHMPTGLKPERGLVCLAKFSLDNQWYRVRVIRFDDKTATVIYCDYGNTAQVPVSGLRQIPAGMDTKTIPVQAKEARLAFV